MENNKIPQGINNIVGDNLKALAQLFPSAVKDGMLDVEALKEELGKIEEVDSEKYELTWSGKQSAKKISQEDVYNRTLKYIAAGSKNPLETENLYIEGDNLEVLKLLRQNYYGSIKMIYIDPPYNTGNDFVYNDKFAMDKKESDVAEGLADEDGNPLQKNEKSKNKYHANWLNMMYPRLKIAKNLLTDDGVVFISIDDYEVDNLKKVCDEVFGQENNISTLIWDLGTGTTAGHFTRGHEYVLCYSRNKNMLPNFKNYNKGEYIRHGALKKISVKNPAVEIIFPKGFRFEGENATFTGEIGGSEKTYILSDEMQFINGKLVKDTTLKAGFAMKNQVENFIKGHEVFDSKGQRVTDFYFNSSGVLFYEKEKTIINPRSVLSNLATTKKGTDELKLLMGNNFFDFPKYSQMIKFFIQIISQGDNDIILDFFSGSATTAHAVMQLNAEDGGNRKFIMVQFPEITDEKSEAYNAGYKNICEIGKERIRRAGEKIKLEIEQNNEQLKLDEPPKKVPDIGFKVFRTTDTNIKWNIIENSVQQSVLEYANDCDRMDFVFGAKDIDVVYEIMLRQKDVPLSDTLEILDDIGERTYLYASSYLVCLETEITTELLEKIAALAPLPIKFVFRDSAFKDDIDLKDYSFRHLKALVERNSGEKKQTYTVEFI